MRKNRKTNNNNWSHELPAVRKGLNRSGKSDGRNLARERCCSAGAGISSRAAIYCSFDFLYIVRGVQLPRCGVFSLGSSGGSPRSRGRAGLLSQPRPAPRGRAFGTRRNTVSLSQIREPYYTEYGIYYYAVVGSATLL